MADGKFHFDNVFFKQPQQYSAVRLLQIGDLYCGAEHEIPSHLQSCHEISCIVAGSGVFTRDSEPFAVTEGDLFLSPMGQEHRIVSSRHDPLRFFYCGFTFDRTHPDYARYEKLDRLMAAKDSPLAKDRYGIAAIFAMLFNEVRGERVDKAVLMEAGLNQLLLLTRRCFDADATQAHWLQTDDSLKKQLVYKTVHYVDNHIFHIRKLTDIADELGYSYSYITQAFSAVMGTSLSVYYRQQRMKKAAELLNNAVTVTQVADVLGFDSLPSFSRSFKSFYGVSPTEYRQR